MNYNVLGVSSGIGVSLWPFRKHVIGNIEPRAIFHTSNEVQWFDNFRDVPLYKHFPKAKTFQPVDVIISSPDCGSGSVLRYSRAKKLGDIKDNASLDYFFAAIKKYNPKFFYFENLPAMFKSLPEDEWDEQLKEYKMVKHMASVSMWGNSQLHRKRLVVIGIRRDLSGLKKYFELPDLRYDVRTCQELYGDLDEYDKIPEDDVHQKNWMKGVLELAHVREMAHNEVTMYSGYKIPIFKVRELWRGEFKKKRRWPVTNRKFLNAPGVYRNRKNDYPATARKANRQFDHNGKMLTPRQLARIQGVPDEFKIYMDLDKLNYWINKGRAAVTKTPPMEISRWFKTCLEDCYKHWSNV